MTTNAVALNCTLKASPAPSSTDLICSQLGDALAAHDVELEVIRIVDHKVAEGVRSDEGDGDEWPAIRRRILDARIVVVATPIWLGNPSSVCRKVLERMDAFLGETDEDGRLITYGRVGMAVAVGNEDGAHNVHAQVFQGLVDVGFTVPASAQPYWVGEAMGSVDYRDLDEAPESVATAIKTAASNAAHLAKLLEANPYPPVS